MFERIKTIWKMVRNTMFDKGTIKNVIGENIAMSDTMASHIRLWSELYSNGGLLDLPAGIAREMARLISIEMKSEITGDGGRAKALNKKYSEIIGDIRIPLEEGCAKGGLVFKPYIKGKTIEVDYIPADAFYPLAFNSSGKITAAVFVDRVTKGNKYYTRLERHELKGNAYTVSNKVYESYQANTIGVPSSFSAIDDWAELQEEMTFTNIKQPLFGYFKPAIANNKDTSSPLGVSVYSGAVELIEEAEKQFDRYTWEFESGERALIANAMAFKKGTKGEIKLPDKRLYKALDVEDMNFFKEWTPELRGDAFDKGLDSIYRKIEFNCGLAYGTISSTQNVDKTAEEIKASKQRSYATVSDNQRALKNALCDLVYAMDVLCTIYNLAPMNTYEISFDFDDSIVADRKAEFAEKQALVSAGIMQRWEFRAWYFGEDEKTAKANVSDEFDGVPTV